MADEVIVYTDGACRNNQKRTGASLRAGLGVYSCSGRGEPFEHKEAYTGPDVTNNQMELLAILRAVQWGSKQGTTIVILTDSRYCLRGLVELSGDTIVVENHSIATGYVSKWIPKGWRKSNGKEVKNRAIWQAVAKTVVAFYEAGGSIRMVHVKGHSGDPGNEAADRLANEAIDDEIQSSASR